jgi:hypothetical protein
MAIAVGWDSDRLVIWQISRSPRANVASTTAGRRLLDRRSVNGNGTTTTSPPTKSATPHPLQEYPNPPPRLTPRAAAKHARPRFHHCRRRVPADAAEKRAPPAAHSPGRARVPRSRIWLWVTCDKGSVGQRHFGKRRPSGADHEEHPPELIALDATRSWRCRRASYPRSRPDFSRRRRNSPSGVSECKRDLLFRVPLSAHRKPTLSGDVKCQKPTIPDGSRNGEDGNSRSLPLKLAARLQPRILLLEFLTPLCHLWIHQAAQKPQATSLCLKLHSEDERVTTKPLRHSPLPLLPPIHDRKLSSRSLAALKK